MTKSPALWASLVGMRNSLADSGLRQPVRGAAGPIAGALLVLLGAVVLLVQYLPHSLPMPDLGPYGWPLLVVAPGLLLMAAGLTRRSVAVLSIPGSIVATTGLLLLVQNTFGLFATWAYAWTLVAVVAPGIGLLLMGRVAERPRLRAAGGRLIAVGGALFAAGAVFFEGILRLSGFDFGSVFGTPLAALLIAAGIVLVAWNRIFTEGREARE